MDISTDDFRRHFDLLSDEALLDTDRDELTETAQQCYDEELAQRGLRPQSQQAKPADEEEPTPEQQDLVPVATYEDPEEAMAAAATLQQVGIPSRLIQQELLVEASDFFKALDALGLHLSDEELAAQAEAAEPEA